MSSRALEQLDVRADRRQRRAQLVRGVGHELALGVARGLQRAEHRVEGRRPGGPGSSSPSRLDAVVQVAGGGRPARPRRSAARAAAWPRARRRRPSPAATPTPPTVTASRIQRSRPSVSSTSVSGLAICSVEPSGPRVVSTRTCTPSTVSSRSDSPRLPEATSRTAAVAGSDAPVAERMTSPLAQRDLDDARRCRRGPVGGSWACEDLRRSRPALCRPRCRRPPAPRCDAADEDDLGPQLAQRGVDAGRAGSWRTTT